MNIRSLVIPFLIISLIIVPFSFSYAEVEIPAWVKNNAGWWAEGLIEDSDFVTGIQYLIEKGIITIEQKIIEYPGESLFRAYTQQKYLFAKDELLKANVLFFEMIPDKKELYEELSPSKEQKTAAILPVFTASAYEEPGFYNYYRGECDISCLSTKIQEDLVFGFTSSGNSIRILELLGYELISDIDVDKNPEILAKYDKLIVLHNEYVTKKEFNGIINHPKVIYLYPNALYAEVATDYETNLISLIRGHGFPDSKISNGFDWEFDNTHPYEQDTDCIGWEFYEIKNGIMLNCYPEYIIFNDEELLKKIKEY